MRCLSNIVISCRRRQKRKQDTLVGYKRKKCNHLYCSYVIPEIIPVASYLGVGQNQKQTNEKVFKFSLCS